MVILHQAIAFEDDPHNAALQDNPKGAKIMSLSFGPPIELGVVTYASVIFPITNELGDTSGHYMPGWEWLRLWIDFILYAGVPEMLPNKHRALSLGLLEAGVGFQWGAVAIILGNALYVHSNWRCIFCKSIISKVVASVRTAFTYFPPPRPRGDYNKSRWKEVKEIDFIVVALFAAGLTTLLIRLTWGWY
ncbi:hypothetical protein BKA61DRAFT_581224 [Leptodontidium sp. MPI-SDFR-AT-0119]|nr:hypothetical protein BKA61DRAFT_581224 [Leptodontidium sp. MPI-SDFR-AT-0119]